jgi:hypothetical protein
MPSEFESTSGLIHWWGQSPHDPITSQKPHLWALDWVSRPQPMSSRSFHSQNMSSLLLFIYLWYLRQWVISSFNLLTGMEAVPESTPFLVLCCISMFSRVKVQMFIEYL